MSREPDEFDLELQLAGAELEPEVREAVASDPRLAPARAELAALRTWWDDHQPPLGSPRAQRRTWLWATGAVAVAAAAAAILIGIGHDVPRFQARGAPDVDLLRVRAGAPVDPTSPVRAGDQLSIALIPDRSVYVNVATLQDDGAVSLLALGVQVDAGERFAIPGRISLDAYVGREWLVVLTATEPRTATAVESLVDDLLPDPARRIGADGYVIEVTRGQPPR